MIFCFGFFSAAKIEEHVFIFTIFHLAIFALKYLVSLSFIYYKVLPQLFCFKVSGFALFYLLQVPSTANFALKYLVSLSFIFYKFLPQLFSL